MLVACKSRLVCLIRVGMWSAGKPPVLFSNYYVSVVFLSPSCFFLPSSFRLSISLSFPFLSIEFVFSFLLSFLNFSPFPFLSLLCVLHISNKMQLPYCILEFQLRCANTWIHKQWNLMLLTGYPWFRPRDRDSVFIRQAAFISEMSVRLIVQCLKCKYSMCCSLK